MPDCLAKLGPLSNQKNYTSVMVRKALEVLSSSIVFLIYQLCHLQTPLMALNRQPEEATYKTLSSLSSRAFVESDLPLTAFVVGNHNHHCRWYPEDATLVADNIEVR
jgi:hypothetical protein